jgi:DNA-binding ferritin-like protein (Dps family)
MKLVLKETNLKEITENDIMMHDFDTDKFVEYIKIHLDKANNLIENKVLDLEPEELYNALKDVFEIKYDDQDYIDILSDVNKKHYTQILHLNTTMVDNEGYNISCIGAATKAVPNYTGKVNLSELRNITNSYDFAIFKQVKHKLNDEFKQAEKYENMQYVSFDGDITKNEDLLESILNLLRKTIKDKKVLKQVLSDLDKYIKDLMWQAKQIAKLSEEQNPQVKQIGLLYKKALEENFNKKSLTQKDNHKRRY